MAAAAAWRTVSCKLDKVVNAIVVRGRDQIMLKVTVAEVERDLIKQLGINLSGSLGYGAAVVNFNNNNPFTVYGQSLSGSSIAAGWKSITGTLQAMEQAGVIHTLAEPTLTAISGEKATFFAGGQFPVLNGFSCNAPTSTPGWPGRRPASPPSSSRTSASLSTSCRWCSAEVVSASM